MKLNFLINKKFIYIDFLQSLINWSSTSFNYYSYKYYEQKFGNHPTDKEIKAMHDLYIFLKESSKTIYRSEKIKTKVLSTYASKWIWSFYDENKIIEDQNELNIYNNLINAFSNKLDIIWGEEYDNLNYWKEFLEKYDFSVFDDFMTKLNIFFNTKVEINEINVYLIFNFNKNFVSGYSSQLIPDKIKIGLNSLDKNRYECIISTIIHEIIHSNFESQSKLFYKHCLYIDYTFDENYKKEIKKKYPKIYFIPHIIEIIFNTLSTGCLDVSYIGKKYFKDSLSKYDHNVFFNSNNGLSSLIYRSSDSLYPYTEKYIENNKKIDKRYINKAIDISIHNLI